MKVNIQYMDPMGLGVYVSKSVNGKCVYTTPSIIFYLLQDIYFFKHVLPLQHPTAHKGYLEPVNHMGVSKNRVFTPKIIH